MLKCATSLWSADLSNLATEIKRVEPYSDRFHIDVADADMYQPCCFSLIWCMPCADIQYDRLRFT